MSFFRLAAASVCALSSAASAIVVTNVVPTFEPIGPGLTENPNVDGLGIVAFDDATFLSTGTFLLVGLKGGTTYGVRIDSNGSGQAVAQAFTAQTFLGIGMYQTSMPGDATFGTVVDIFRWDGDPDPFNLFEVSSSEERARGFGSNVN